MPAKAAGRPVHALLGGAVRDAMSYFGFPQGETPEQIALDARRWADSGCAVIYVKVGRGDRLDHAIVEQVRAAIGSHRLRLDASEAWDVLTARRMMRSLARFDIELLEQPTSADSPAALRALRPGAVPVAADQSIYSPEGTFQLCRDEAADLIVLGLHEAGGITRLLKCAAIAETAGVTTCATMRAGAVIANLDDGNQIMNHLLVEDIVATPDLSLDRGRLPTASGPGLGFTLDWDAVGRAAECYEAKPA